MFIILTVAEFQETRLAVDYWILCVISVRYASNPLQVMRRAVCPIPTSHLLIQHLRHFRLETHSARDFLVKTHAIINGFQRGGTPPRRQIMSLV